MHNYSNTRPVTVHPKEIGGLFVSLRRMLKYYVTAQGCHYNETYSTRGSVTGRWAGAPGRGVWMGREDLGMSHVDIKVTQHAA